MPMVPSGEKFNRSQQDWDWREVQICRGGTCCLRKKESRIKHQSQPGGCPECIRVMKFLPPDAKTMLPPMDTDEDNPWGHWTSEEDDIIIKYADESSPSISMRLHDDGYERSPSAVKRRIYTIREELCQTSVMGFGNYSLDLFGKTLTSSISSCELSQIQTTLVKTLFEGRGEATKSDCINACYYLKRREKQNVNPSLLKNVIFAVNRKMKEAKINSFIFSNKGILNFREWRVL